MSQYKYSPTYGLQAGALRQAGVVAVFERIIDRLIDKIGLMKSQWGTTDLVFDLRESITIEYPDTILRLPHLAIQFIGEAVKEPGIGRVMVDGKDDHIGFTKVVRFYIDIWARRSLERFLVADAVVNVLAESWKYFRQYGIRDLKHVGTQSRNYEQERSALYQRMTAQQGSRVYRQIVEYEVEFDLVNIPRLEAGTIEQINIIGAVIASIGGTTELILDKEFLLTKELKGVLPDW